MVVVSFEKPPNFDQLFKTYCDSLTKNNICIFPSEIQIEEDNAGGDEDNDDDEEHEPERMAYYERKTKKPDATRGAALKRSIFATLDGFESTQEMERCDYPDKVFCVDSNYIMQELNKTKKPILMAYPGAVVLPLRETVFSKTDDEVAINACDFTSLYPKTMIRWNICKTVAAFNPQYAVNIDGGMYDPMDETKFNVSAIPFEFNKKYVPVCVILARPEFKQSAMTNFILGIIKLRKETKAKQKEALAAGEQVVYMLLENKQNAYKLVINTTYGAMFTKSFTIQQNKSTQAGSNGGR